jgi:hypothetical protein
MVVVFVACMVVVLLDCVSSIACLDMAFEPKRRYSVVDEMTLQNALRDVLQGNQSQRLVSKRYGIPRGTLQNKMKKMHMNKPGCPTILSEEEEKCIVDHLIKLSEWGFPFTKTDLKITVKMYLDKEGRQEKRLKNNYPGREWTSLFLRRHHEITQRMTQNIAPKRSEVDKEEVKEYFTNLRESLEGIPPENIVNYDETNLVDDPGRKKAIYKRGTKYPERSIHSSKSAVSVMFAGSATGKLLPPYVVYKSEHLWDSWTEGGPENTRYNRSKSGWFDTFCFEDWFTTIALPHFRRLNGQKVLIGDNLSSHFSPSVLEACERNQISFICLPANSTHLCQPLDVAFFHPLKVKWRQILTDWKSTGKRSKVLSKDQFPKLLGKLIDNINPQVKQNLVSGFRKTGIHPLNENEVLNRLPSDDRNVQSSVSEVFMEQLKVMRHGEETDRQPRKRRRKIQVEPGKSVNTAVNNPQPGTSRQSDLEEENDSDTDGNDLDSPNLSSDDDAASLENANESDEETDTGEEQQSTEFEEGNHILVSYTMNRRQQHYVGKIVEVLQTDQYRVMFLRRCKGSSAMFVYPDVADQDVIQKVQIVRKLPAPTLRRGTHTFPDGLGKEVFCM